MPLPLIFLNFVGMQGHLKIAKNLTFIFGLIKIYLFTFFFILLKIFKYTLQEKNFKGQDNIKL